MSQGQDAKLFQRGKIQVRIPVFDAPASLLIPARDSTGVSGRAARSGEQGQEVHQKEDGIEEDRGKYHHGQRQLVPFFPILPSTQMKLTNHRFEPVSPLFTDVVQCLGTPLLEIKKSCVDSTQFVDPHVELIHNPSASSGLPVSRQLRTVKTRPDSSGHSEFLTSMPLSFSFGYIQLTTHLGL